ncbi:MAG TPA: hypothetical protein VNU66_08860 [Mycobacteriales bacterium]|nr:hypothetical protein [Mycobacteriales bacterium]
MSEPTTAQHPGSGPTQAGAHNAAGPGLDAAVAGATLVLTVYGLVVILADLLFHAELIPHSGFQLAGIMVACLVVGAVLGGGAGKAAARR